MVVSVGYSRYRYRFFGTTSDDGERVMTFELWSLLAATFWGVVHLSCAAFSFKAQVGNAYSVGARDENIQPTGMAARLQRAQANFMQTYAFFAVCVLLVFVTDSAGQLSYWGCLGYLLGRLLFLPLYALGTPWLRTFSWNLATLGLVTVGVQLLL